MRAPEELDWIELQILDILSRTWIPTAMSDAKLAMPLSMVDRFDIALSRLKEDGLVTQYRDSKTGIFFIEMTPEGKQALLMVASKRTGC